MSKTLFWFRRDLRWEDHAGLEAANQMATGGVQPLFIFDTEAILNRLEDRDDPRVGFIFDELEKLGKWIQDQGGDLWILQGDPIQVWAQLIKEVEFDRVIAVEDYEPYARKRDKQVALLLKEAGREFRVVKDQVIFHKNDILTDQKKPYTVYTPYKKKWLATLTDLHLANANDSSKKMDWRKPVAKHQLKLRFASSLADLGFSRRKSFSLPEAIVQKTTILNYKDKRDFPAEVGGTTRLGLHLRFGTVSPRQLLRSWGKMSSVWESELIWREFFMQILFHFPESETRSFRPEYDAIEWRTSKDEFERWCAGETGYPLVDAGMRELNTTGYMHNRVRMVVASFLCKHLLHHWREGERYFARRLLDFDLSANVGNWQWAAGSGCDAAPYFRVFNPTTQLEKFDPDRVYIKRWVPEWMTGRYPQPMVEHTFARERALREYKKGIEKGRIHGIPTKETEK